MSKKRTSLDAIMTRVVEDACPNRCRPRSPSKESDSGNRPGIKQQTAYLKEPVYEQLRRLAFEERAQDARLSD